MQKKPHGNIFIDAGLNLIGKKIKKGISSITDWRITLTNNEMEEFY